MRLCTHLGERFEQVGRDQRLNVRVAVDGAIRAQVGAEERQQPRGLDVGRLRADLQSDDKKEERDAKETKTGKVIKSDAYGKDTQEQECARMTNDGDVPWKELGNSNEKMSKRSTIETYHVE